MDHRITDLGDLEREVLELVWAHGPVPADAIQKQLTRPLKESTVRTVLTRLERKGYLKHTIDNRSFIYSATQSRTAAAARAVKSIVDRFCDGSVEALLVGMVDSEVLDRTELQRLAERIAAARQGKKA